MTSIDFDDDDDEHLFDDVSFDDVSLPTDYENELDGLDDLVLDDIDIELEAQNISLNLLPPRSKAKYTKAYDKFMAWKTKKTSDPHFSEPLLLVYFQELSTKYLPSTLWSLYSMIRANLVINHDVDISNYLKLKRFLKIKKKGFKSKKAPVFTSSQISKFLNEALDEEYLDVKVR